MILVPAALIIAFLSQAISIRTKAIHLAIYANMTMIMRWMSMKMTKPQAMNRINLRSLEKARELE